MTIEYVMSVYPLIGEVEAKNIKKFMDKQIAAASKKEGVSKADLIEACKDCVDNHNWQLSPTMPWTMARRINRAKELKKKGPKSASTSKNTKAPVSAKGKSLSTFNKEELLEEAKRRGTKKRESTLKIMPKKLLYKFVKSLPETAPAEEE